MDIHADVSTKSAGIAIADRADRTHVAAMALADARRSGILIDALPRGVDPDSVEAALSIQRARPDRVIGGWKCALPTADRLILAPIDAVAIVETATPVRVETVEASYEAEFAFVLARDLPARAGGHDRASVLAAIGSTRLALEIVHGRFRRPGEVGFLAMLADDLFNEAVVLGPVVEGTPPTAIVTTDTGGERRFAARHPAGDPLAPLIWLADHLAGNGTPLIAGMTVITGSFIPSQVVRGTTAVRVRYEGLGVIETTLIVEGDSR